MTEIIKKKIIEGDNAAFSELYNQYCNRVYSVAMSVVKDEFDAEDIMQEVFIALPSKLEGLADLEKFESWLFRMAKNKAIDSLRKRKDASFTEVEAASSEDFCFEDTLENENRDFVPEESLDYNETKRIVQEIINTLPEEQRECVMLRFAKGYSLQEIADATGVPLATVKSRLKYGKAKIETEVKEQEKKGVKLYGVSGLLLIPFLRWMLANGTFSATLAASGVSAATATAASTAAGTVGSTTASVAAKTGIVAKFSTLSGAAKAAIAGVTAAVAIGAVAIGVAGSAPMEINLEDYIDVKFSGLNGSGTARVVVDEDGIADIEIDKEALLEYAEEILPYRVDPDRADLSEVLEFEIVGDDENLSNGDEVTVELVFGSDLALLGETMEDFEEALNIKFEPIEFTFTVSGLKDSKEFDCYSFIEDYVVFEGANGDIRPSVEFPAGISYNVGDFTIEGHTYSGTDSVNVIYKGENVGLLFYSTTGEKLSRGDTYRVYIDIQEGSNLDYVLENAGYVIPESVDFEVPDSVPDYLTSPSQITEDILQQLTEQYLATAEQESFTEITDVSGYVYNIKPEYRNGYDGESGVLVIFHTTRRKWLTPVKTGYVVLDASLIKVYPDGTVDCKFSSVNGNSFGDYPATFEEAYESILNHEKYNHEKIF